MEQAKLAVGLPDALKPGKVFVRPVQKMGKGIKRLEFLFLGRVEIAGNEDGDWSKQPCSKMCLFKCMQV